MTIATSGIPAEQLEALEAFAHSSVGPELRDVLLALSDAARGGSVLQVIDMDMELTPSQVAERLGMSRTHLYKMLDRGEIMFHRVGRDRRIPMRDVVSFEVRRQNDRRELAERFATQERTRTAAVDEIADLL